MMTATISKKEMLAQAINWDADYIPDIKPILDQGANIFPDAMAAKIAPKRELMFRCLVASGLFLNFWGNNFTYGEVRQKALLDFAVAIARKWVEAYHPKLQVCLRLLLKDANGCQKDCQVSWYEVCWSNGGQTYMSRSAAGYRLIENERYGDI